MLCSVYIHDMQWLSPEFVQAKKHAKIVKCRIIALYILFILKVLLVHLRFRIFSIAYVVFTKRRLDATFPFL